MVTSTSTPGSMLMDVTCLTVSDAERRSMTRLWILIWNLSHVLEPSPHGVFLVVMRSTFVGRRTGPYTSSFFSRDPLMRSAQTGRGRGWRLDARSRHTFLQTLDVGARQRDPDSMDLRLQVFHGLLRILHGSVRLHVCV